RTTRWAGAARPGADPHRITGGPAPDQGAGPPACRRAAEWGTLTIVQGSDGGGCGVSLDEEALAQLRKRVLAGGAEKYHAANAAKGKLFARERIALLVDEGSFIEDGRYANALADGLPADGVVTGLARIDGRDVCLMANDSTVKAGSWGARTVEKIIRIIERAYTTGVPMVYLVDSAGARITDQVDLFPGRRGAGRIF